MDQTQVLQLRNVFSASYINLHIIRRYGKYGKKANWIVKWYVKYGRKVSWIVKRYEKCKRKIGWIVKWYGKYGIKVSCIFRFIVCFYNYNKWIRHKFYNLEMSSPLVTSIYI
jgi:hypothetical protein